MQSNGKCAVFHTTQNITSIVKSAPSLCRSSNVSHLLRCYQRCAIMPVRYTKIQHTEERYKDTYRRKIGVLLTSPNLVKQNVNYKTFTQNPNDINKQNYITFRNKLNHTIRKAKQTYYYNIFKECDIKKTWSCTN